MKRILVDTNSWIALNSKRDNFHEKSVRINKEILLGGQSYVTTNYVLDETYTGLLIKASHYIAVDFGEKIRSSRKIEIIHVSPEIEGEAWELFKKHSDKEYSFTDCTSFVVMRRLKINEAFTNDHHFEQMGFRILLK